MQASRFLFSPVEQATIARILRDFPEAAQALQAGVRPIVGCLARECRGLLRSKDEADYVLAGLADRIAGRTITGMREGDDSEMLQVLAIDLLTRHLLAGMRADFLHSALAR
jgi:hypothetical protein